MSHRRRPYKPLETPITVKPDLGGRGLVYSLWGLLGGFAVIALVVFAMSPSEIGGTAAASATTKIVIPSGR